MTYFLYDGSFEGLLTSIFEIYEYKLDKVSICKISTYEKGFFNKEIEVITQQEKSTRLQKGIIKMGSALDFSQIYRAFLSELNDVEDLILNYTQYLFTEKRSVAKDYANKYVLEISQIVKKIGREKHRMDAFVRFRLTKDNIYFATVAPDFNVLPLNEAHFRKRYADQKWCIYDLKRNYGIFYDLHKTEIISLDLPTNILSSSEEFFKPEELHFQQLWKNYFKSTTISSRINKKLHQQHVPKRYWKYLSEKYLQV